MPQYPLTIHLSALGGTLTLLSRPATEYVLQLNVGNLSLLFSVAKPRASPPALSLTMHLTRIWLRFFHNEIAEEPLALRVTDMQADVAQSSPPDLGQARGVVTALLMVKSIEGRFGLRSAQELFLFNEIWLDRVLASLPAEPPPPPAGRVAAPIPVFLTAIVKRVSMRADVGLTEANFAIKRIQVRLDRKVQRQADQVGGLFWVVDLRGVELAMRGALEGQAGWASLHFLGRLRYQRGDTHRALVHMAAQVAPFTLVADWNLAQIFRVQVSLVSFCSSFLAWLGPGFSTQTTERASVWPLQLDSLARGEACAVLAATVGCSHRCGEPGADPLLGVHLLAPLHLAAHHWYDPREAQRRLGDSAQGTRDPDPAAAQGQGHQVTLAHCLLAHAGHSSRRDPPHWFCLQVPCLWLQPQRRQLA